MKLRLFVLSAVLMSQGVVWSAERVSRPTESVRGLLGKLKSECDNPKVSNQSRWTSYLSVTEIKRKDAIAALRAVAGTEAQVRRELMGAKGEYREMLVVTLAAFGDNTSIWQAGRLMVGAKEPAVRVCAAWELRRLKDKRLMEPFKQALADPFERLDGVCVEPKMIFPVRLIASAALVGLGLSLEETRQFERQRLVDRLSAKFQKRTDVEANWKHLLSDLGKGQPLARYNDQQVLLRGTVISGSNPIQVKIADSEVVGVVYLREQDAKTLAVRGSEGDSGFGVEVRGVVRSVDSYRKRIEVWSMESTASAVD